MTYATIEDNEAIVIQVCGELDAMSVPEIRGTVDRVVAQAPRQVVVDCSDLQLIDSSGVGAIVSLYKRVRAHGGTVVVTGLRDQPLAIFRLLKLDTVLLAEEAPPMNLQGMAAMAG